MTPKTADVESEKNPNKTTPSTSIAMFVNGLVQCSESILDGAAKPRLLELDSRIAWYRKERDFQWLASRDDAGVNSSRNTNFLANDLDQHSWAAVVLFNLKVATPVLYVRLEGGLQKAQFEPTLLLGRFSCTRMVLCTVSRPLTEFASFCSLSPRRML